MDKIISILKPTGMTSNDVVGKARKILKIKKIGHTGTLDPDAAGVLPICIGRATKVSELILNKEKSYLCELTLGAATDTYDSSGEILFKAPEDFEYTEEAIKKAFESQMGDIEQYPPKYSALKVNGKRMCDLVRSGREDEIVLKPRKVTIKKLEILSIDNNKVRFYVECSKGTYIRSICYDIGEILGCGGHMSFLLRTSSGKFNLENSITLDELEKFVEEGTVEEHAFDIDYTLDSYPRIVLRDNAVKYYSNGGIIESYRFDEKNYTDKDEYVRVYSHERFIGVGRLIRENGKTSVKSDKIFV
ncbi:tRNA pseudouridine(55) synthase TruB [Peptostreptococcaceae bacterium]|uniref:tRNA pseudouridine(55) synthase TruB n=1 Tax=Peptacetobacter sp. AB845 TaxID=3388429 RepID=UPI0015C0F15D